VWIASQCSGRCQDNLRVVARGVLEFTAPATNGVYAEIDSAPGLSPAPNELRVFAPRSRRKRSVGSTRAGGK
jgi:hypothetical protein